MKRASAATLALAALTACNPQIPKNAVATPTPAPSASPMALRITGSGTSKEPVRITQQVGNRRQYDLIARSFVSNGVQGNARARFAKPHVTFYGKDGSTLIADAPRAALDQGANTVELEGGVTAHTGTGTKLQCDTLLYDRKSEMFHGTGHVVITDRNGFRATGNQVDSDITLSHARMQ